ncbi:MAG: Outer membrane lipoprotein [Candidatus Ruthia sp. Asou_11_S2]|nr:Outer membrane lipoprotein [Candidatus Ruthia sp. Asou_11_S2]
MKNKIVLLALSVIFLSSCQSSMNRFTQDERGTNTYSSAETGQLSSVLEGRIISIKPIKLSGSKALGAGVGTALGAAVAASAVGGERDKIPVAIVGGLLGAMAGRAIEENATAETGFEFLIKLSSGQIKAFVQKSQQGLRVGDQVYVIHGGQTVRLTRQ